MVLAGLVQNAGHLFALALNPAAVSRTSILEDSVEDGEKGESDDRFLVYDVKLVADRSNGNTGSGGGVRSLGGDAGSGERVKKRLGLLLRLLLRDVGGVAGGGKLGRDSAESRSRYGGSDACSAYNGSVRRPIVEVQDQWQSEHTESASCQS